MTYDLSALSISSITSNATSLLSSIAPFLELLLGVLLAFMIINYIVRAINHKPSDDLDQYDVEKY